MRYFELEPEVAGGWGPGTVANRTVHPPQVEKLEYEFDGWLGDYLLETFPCFIVAGPLSSRLAKSDLSGFRLSEVHITRSAEFDAWHGSEELPEFKWLQVQGTAGVDDFGVSNRHTLVVSERALLALRTHPLSHCIIREWAP